MTVGVPNAGPPADERAGTLYRMEVDRIWSAAELEALTPDERAATIRAGFVNDPAGVPADLVENRPV